MMKTSRVGIDTRDFSDILAALCETARDGCGTEHAAQAEDEAIRRILPALTPGEPQ